MKNALIDGRVAFLFAFVQSATNPLASYTIWRTEGAPRCKGATWACSCPDFEHRGEQHPCKHLRSIWGATKNGAAYAATDVEGRDFALTSEGYSFCIALWAHDKANGR